MGLLTGKVAWVTGAGSGIGQAAAIALAKEGATVVLTGRRKEPLQETAAAIKAAGGKADVKPGDLMKAASVTKIAKDIEKKYGRCDILVNNAGLNILERQWAKLTPANAEQVIDGNLSSAFYCTTAVLPMMRKRRDGVLIHTALKTIPKVYQSTGDAQATLVEKQENRAVISYRGLWSFPDGLHIGALYEGFRMFKLEPRIRVKRLGPADIDVEATW